MDEIQFKKLLEKYRLGTASPEERTLLESWYLSQSDKTGTEPTIEDLIASDKRLSEKLRQTTGIDVNTGFRRQPKLWSRISVAASILVLLSVGAYLLLPSKPSQEHMVAVKLDIPAGGNKAILTLGNGKQIILTDGASGTIASQGNATVINTNSGKLLYKTDNPNSNSEVVTNSVSTPRGGQYEVILPDGSHVWLNAASSISFPTAFIGLERKVKITGEAYFEITHNQKQPFKVTANGQVVEVLGTHFNVNSYSEEGKTVTTLAQGSVKVSTSNSSTIIKPQQQAVLLPGRPVTVQQADLKVALAWKEGKFKFRDTGMPEIMRQIARWYDIDIKYSGEVPTDLFSGTISRQADLSQVLQIFEITEIHFELIQDSKGKTLIIKP